MRGRLFVGIFPTGIAYADREVEVHGDYKRLAFLSFSTLALEVESDCPLDLRRAIERDAAQIQSRCGESFEISACGQTVLLGQRKED